MLNPDLDLPRISGTIQEPLYRAEAHGLELSDDVAQAQNYIQWFVSVNYRVEPTLFQ